MTLDPKLLEPSGLNNQFHGAGLSFQEYLQQTQDMIKKARLDAAQFPDSVMANMPFEWRPHRFDGKRGILLIHGLFDSPFIMRDVARHFLTRGFLVRTILLPGHGTVPGDLLTIKHQEWQKAAAYGVEQLKKDVEEVYISGYSLGGALAIDQALHNPTISALILFSPALELVQHFLALLYQTHILISWFVKRANWYRINPPIDYARYTSYPLNAVDQTYWMCRRTKRTLEANPLLMPLFIAQSADDEVITPQVLLNSFPDLPNPQNRLLYYTTQPLTHADTRIEQRNSAYPEHDILDLSHICLTVAPENPHYGINGDFKDFMHYYPKLQPPPR